MAYSKAGILNAGFIVFAGAILVTAIFGRWFCGWSCHLVALQDLCRWLLLKIGIRPKPLRSRLLGLVPYLAFVYMFLWPAAYRLWLGDSLGVRGTEYTTSALWATFPGWTIGTLTLLVCGFVTVYFLGVKGGTLRLSLRRRVRGGRQDRPDAGAGERELRQFGPLHGSVHFACVSTRRWRRRHGRRQRLHEARDLRLSVCPTDALSFSFGRLPLLATARKTAPPAASAPGPDLAKRVHPLSRGEASSSGSPSSSPSRASAASTATCPS